METAQHWDRLAKNQPAEIAMFQISEVQEAPAFNGGRSFLALRVPNFTAETFVEPDEAQRGSNDKSLRWINPRLR
jgi:hypothetical protein